MGRSFLVLNLVAVEEILQLIKREVLTSSSQQQPTHVLVPSAAFSTGGKCQLSGHCPILPYLFAGKVVSIAFSRQEMERFLKDLLMLMVMYMFLALYARNFVEVRYKLLIA